MANSEEPPEQKPYTRSQGWYIFPDEVKYIQSTAFS